MVWNPSLAPASAALADEPLDRLRLRPDLGHPRDPALVAAGLLHQEMVPGPLAAHDLPGPVTPEPLGRSPVRLHLWHRLVLVESVARRALARRSPPVSSRPT